MGAAPQISPNERVAEFRKTFARAEAEVARVIVGHRDPRAVDALIGVLRDRSPDVRARAAESLGKLGDRRAIEPRQALVKTNSRSPRVLRQAEAAIAKLQRRRRRAKSKSSRAWSRARAKRPPSPLPASRR